MKQPSMASLYLHIPFCEHKCIYCDFYSIAPKESPSEHHGLVERFLRAIKGEVALRAGEERFHVSYETIFFGGGTPSLLSPSNIAEILDTLSRSFPIEPGAEITLETNPGTVDRRKLKEFRAAGVNRLSMGIQSFHDDDLKFLSRIHSSDQAKQCVRDAYDAGFENVSFDLIFALPSQTPARWRSNLEQAVGLRPTHMSCYSLIVEPNTPLFRMVESKQVSTLNAEDDATLYEMTMDVLARHGFEQYEVSNFAQPGFRSRHNANYWNHSNYLGFGPSAHSFWSDDQLIRSAKRWWNISNVVGYSERVEHGTLPLAGEETLVSSQLIDEAILLGLRADGIDVAGFRKRYGAGFFDEHRARIAELERKNLAVLEGERLRLTPKGYLLCDEICLSLR
jgi:oxygen-independent coproporphyrinogen-3 oxidase